MGRPTQLRAQCLPGASVELVEERRSEATHELGLTLLLRHSTAFRQADTALLMCSSTSFALAGIGVPGP
jgi:hypothetical protein